MAGGGGWGGGGGEMNVCSTSVADLPCVGAADTSGMQSKAAS